MQSKIQVLMTLTLLCSGIAVAQTKPVKPTPTPPEIANIIQRFAAAESKNKVARNSYLFTQDVDIATIGPANNVTGRFHRTSDIIYDDLGNRIEKITFNPVSTLTEISMSQEDMKDIAGVQPFALTAEDLPKYQVDYVGKEKIDELDLYVFDVKPKKPRDDERYLEGRIWVDDRDLQIVKVKGKAVPEIKDQKFPVFETYRENIDGRYWFPTYTYADCDLDFKRGPSVHIRVTIKYTDYKKFTTRIRLADEGEAASEGDVKAAGKAGTDKARPADASKPPAKPNAKPEPTAPTTRPPQPM